MATTNPIESYTQLLSSDYWAYIKQVSDYYPADFFSRSITEQRSIYNQQVASVVQPLPSDVQFEDLQLKTDKGSVPARFYQTKDQAAFAHILYFHGGGFVFGDLNSHHGICAELCASTGFRVTSVDYRLAPEHLYPAALQDAELAYQALSARERLPIIIMGDSAGACLAAHAAHQSRSTSTKPLAQVLIYPVLGSDLSLISYQRYAKAPLLTTDEMQHFWTTWLGTEQVPKKLEGIPLADPNFRGVPKTIVFSAEYDPLVGDAELYCAQVRVAGGEAHLHHEDGLTHGYLHARHQVASAQASFARIQAALKALVA